MPSNAFSGYPPTSRDYAYYGQAHTSKRPRMSSIDLGTRGMYDTDGRMRQMDAYPQTAIYNQAGGYPTPIMQGYPTGHTAVPDYAVRPPPSFFLNAGILETATSPQVSSPEAGQNAHTSADVVRNPVVHAGTPDARPWGTRSFQPTSHDAVLGNGQRTWYSCMDSAYHPSLRTRS